MPREDDVIPRDDDDIGDVMPLRSETAHAVVFPTTAELLPKDSGSSVTGLVVEVVQGRLLGDARVGTRTRRYGVISDMLLKKLNMKMSASWSMLKRSGRSDTRIIASSVNSSDLLCTTW